MKFDGFDWDQGNIEKCRRHGLTLAEIESVFDGAVIILPDLDHSELENRLRGIGVTVTGRSAFVVFTMRNGKLRPLSARFMHRREVDRYEKDNSDIRE